jgi:hypothetical protein
MKRSIGCKKGEGKMKSYLSSGVARGCLVALFFSASTPVWAQQTAPAAEPDDGIQEIIVTAQKRTKKCPECSHRHFRLCR